MTANFSLAQTAGNWNIVVSGPPGGQSTGIPTDTSGNTYELAVVNLATAGQCQDAYVYVCKGIKAAGAGANTVSIPYAPGGGGAPPDCLILEVSGAAGIGAIAGAGQNNSGGGSVSVSLTTLASSSLVLACGMSDNGWTGVSGSFTEVALTPDTYGGVWQDSVSTPSTVTCSLTQSAGSWCIAAIELTSVAQPARPSPVQQINGTGLSQTFYSAQNAGDSNLFVVQLGATSTPTITVADDANGAYDTASALEYNPTSGLYFQFFWYPNTAAAAAGTNTVTATVTGGGTLSNEYTYAIEVTGLATTGTFYTSGQTSQKTTASGYTPPATSGSYATASAYQFALAWFYSTGDDMQQGAESNLIGYLPNGGVGANGLEYQITGASGSTVQATATFQSSADAVYAQIAGFNAAPATTTFDAVGFGAEV